MRRIPALTALRERGNPLKRVAPPENLGPFRRGRGLFLFSPFSEKIKGGNEMAQEKKFVESITDMEVDFPQWYTDVVKKADLTD